MRPRRIPANVAKLPRAGAGPAAVMPPADAIIPRAGRLARKREVSCLLHGTT
jgi:hypothetical protein